MWLRSFSGRPEARRRDRLARLRRCKSTVLAYGLGMTPDIEVSRDIVASPEAVFAAITDITRMGEWSPETRSAEWNEGFDQAEVGAQYTGHNQNGEKE